MNKNKKDDTVILAFARMNPPTIGHLRLVRTVIAESKKLGAPYRIVISRKQGKDDPLDPEQKMRYIESFFPDIDFRLADDELPDIIAHLEDLAKSFKNVVIVCGSDRLAEFALLAFKYNGDHDGARYTFDSIRTVSCGIRTSDGDPSKASNVSGTLARQLVRNGDLRTFFDIVPWSSTDAYTVVEMYDDIRSAMGINTSDEEGTHAEKDKEEV